MRVDYSAYEGRTVKGVSEIVLSRGNVIVENGKFYGKPGAGAFLKRGTCLA
jgi:dihydropyrimidinase